MSLGLSAKVSIRPFERDHPLNFQKRKKVSDANSMRTPASGTARKRSSKRTKYFGLCKSSSAVRCQEDEGPPLPTPPPAEEPAAEGQAPSESVLTTTTAPKPTSPSHRREEDKEAQPTISLSAAVIALAAVGVLVRAGVAAFLAVPSAGLVLLYLSRRPRPPPLADATAAPSTWNSCESPKKKIPHTTTRKVDALRAYGESLYDCELPTVLDMDKHLQQLLSRRGRDTAWAQKKLAEAVEYRRHPPGMCVEGLNTTTRFESFEALKPYLPSGEPLLSLEGLLNAGRVFKHGNMYIKGIDTQGRPIVWSQPKLLDWEIVQVENAVRALATMSELIALAGKWVGKTKGVCIEYSSIGDSSANKHGKKLLAYMRRLTEVLQKGYAERSGDVVLAPTNAIFRAAFACFRPLFPESIRDSIKLYSLKQGRKRIVELLGDPQALPTFWGGPAEFVFPKLPDCDDLDVCAMMLDFLELVPAKPPGG